jgi:predicted porin
MKKSLLAVAILGATSGFAFAASNVTLYGVIDTGVQAQRIDGGINAKITKDGTTTTYTNAGNKVLMNSGFNAGSRWGIKGVEDLGGGYSVGFILEQGFSSDSGNAALSSQTFSRESIITVNGGFGSLGLGRTGGLAFAQSRAILTGWAFGTSYGASSWNSIDWVAKRMNDVVSYATPSFGGLTVHAMYSNSGVRDTKKDADGNTVINSDTNKWSENGHYYGLGAKLVKGPLTSSLIFEAAQNKDQSSTAKAKYGINFGAAYNLGAITPMFAYQYVGQSEGIKDHQFGLSASIKAAGGTAKIGARYVFGKNDGKAVEGTTSDKRRAWTVGAAYEYPFSKRTMVYGFAGYADGSKQLDKDIPNGHSINYNGYQVAAGLKHSF